jgi:hypothetical protein
MNKFQWLADLLAAAGGRRFLMTVGAGIIHTLLRVGDFISQEIYRELTMATVVVYIAARTYQHTQDSKNRAAPAAG